MEKRKYLIKTLLDEQPRYRCKRVVTIMKLTDAWIEDMLLIMNKISEPIYRDLALKQLKCIAETVSRSDENSCKLLN